MKVPTHYHLDLDEYPFVRDNIGNRIDRLNAKRSIPFKNFAEYMLWLVVSDMKRGAAKNRRNHA